MSRFATLAALALLVPAGAQTATLEAGQGKRYATPSAAIAAAQPGDTVQIFPGTYVDCAVVTQDRLTIEGVGKPEQVVMSEKGCEGKALLVIRGEDVTVRNLTLAGARVPSENGAGIRGESRSITVDEVRFVDNQNGILSGTVGGTLTVRNSDFERNGFCGAACAHGIYAGHLDLLRVENSRFVETRQGHHIKSRAHRTEVVGCDIQDGPNGTASYEIDIPNGGSLIVRDSTIVKGANAENQTAAIMIGAEGITQPTPEIVVANNDFRNDGGYPTIFVDNLTQTDAFLANNKISGPGSVVALKGAGRVTIAR